MDAAEGVPASARRGVDAAPEHPGNGRPADASGAHLDPSFSFSLVVAGGDLSYERVVSDVATWAVSLHRDPSSDQGRWQLHAYCENEAAMAPVEAKLHSYFGSRLRSCTDRVFDAHAGGKLRVRTTVAIESAEDLALVYLPGARRAAQAIARHEAGADEQSGRSNTIAIVTDGSAVLGLGDLGPFAALPVMEGKALLFQCLAGINAVPICLATTEIEEIVQAVTALAPGFAGINLEDIASPRCFAVEQRLVERLAVPVFHDDQHGTAVVVLAAMHNALAVVSKRIEDAHIVVSGAGAAGTAVSRLLLDAGARDVVVWAPVCVLHPAENDRLPPHKRELAAITNPRGVRGGLAEALAGADAFIGVSGAGVLTPELVRTMAPDPVVFALANPVPEIKPEQITGLAAVVATGRSDYPNQINNALVFPGMFRGLLDAKARRVTGDIKLAAARALAALIPSGELGPEHILPEVLDPGVVPAVSAAVAAFASSSPPEVAGSGGRSGR